MAMNANVLRNLTMASAKHLVNAGHISKAHHAKIMQKVAAPAMAANKPPSMMKAANSGVPPVQVDDEGVPGGQTNVPMGRLDTAQGRGAAPMLPEGNL